MAMEVWKDLFVSLKYDKLCHEKVYDVGWQYETLYSK